MRTWAEVSLDRLAHNYHALRGFDPLRHQVHGTGQSRCLRPWSRPHCAELEELGADYLGVACLAEAVELRQAGVQTPILILGGTPAAYAAELVRYHITQPATTWTIASPLGPGTRDGRHLDRPYSVRHRHVPPGLPLP